MDTPKEPLPLPASDLLGVRNELNRRLRKYRDERNWLSEHNHKVEAMVKHAIMDEIERAMWLLEGFLDERGVKYTYEETPNEKALPQGGAKETHE